MIKAVLFDLGNTLVYSNPEETFQRIIAEQGIAKPLEEVMDAMIQGNKEFDTEEHEGLSAQEFYRQWNMVTLKHLCVKGAKVEKLAEEISAHWWKFATFHVYPEVKDTLERLKRRGLKLGIVTGGFEEDIEMILPKTGLDRFFNVRVGVNTVGKRKPHPATFKHALRLLGVEPCEAIFVGDNYLADYVGAQKVGIRPLLIRRKGSPIQRTYTDNCVKLPPDIKTIESLDEIFDVLKLVNL